MPLSASIGHDRGSAAVRQGSPPRIRRHHQRAGKNILTRHQRVENVLEHQPRQLGALGGVEHGGQTRPLR